METYKLEILGKTPEGFTTPRGKGFYSITAETEAEALVKADEKVKQAREQGYRGGMQLICDGSLIVVYSKD